MPAYEFYRSQTCPAWRPPTDVYETEHEMVVQVEIAGMREDDIIISMSERRLVISGQRQDLACQRVYQNMEINYGEFRTEIQFNLALDEAAISANYENGFLYVRLPKLVERRVRVPIRSK